MIAKLKPRITTKQSDFRKIWKNINNKTKKKYPHTNKNSKPLNKIQLRPRKKTPMTHLKKLINLPKTTTLNKSQMSLMVQKSRSLPNLHRQVLHQIHLYNNRTNHLHLVLALSHLLKPRRKLNIRVIKNFKILGLLLLLMTCQTSLASQAILVKVLKPSRAPSGSWRQKRLLQKHQAKR